MVSALGARPNDSKDRPKSRLHLELNNWNFTEIRNTSLFFKRHLRSVATRLVWDLLKQNIDMFRFFKGDAFRMAHPSFKYFVRIEKRTLLEPSIEYA